MIHPKTELKLISNEVGYGVVAKEFIPAGTITWALDKLDREFTSEIFKQMNPLYQNILDTYCYRNKEGKYILCWDNGRFVNHSFNSNCISTAYDFEIAVRDIQPGEELTDDYGYLNVTEPFEGIDEGTARKTVYPDDLLNFHKIWDQKMRQVFYKIPILPQPLRELISSDTWKKVVSISEGKMEMDSILNLYCEK